MPAPSAACQTCKSRRIKCDETKPTCQRCIKSKRECVQRSPGQPSFAFLTENNYASGKTKRPRGPRSSFPGTLRPLQGEGEGAADADLPTRARQVYLDAHLQMLAELPSLMQSTTSFVPTWVPRLDSRMVNLALDMMSLAVYSRTQSSADAAVEARAKYNELLPLARQAIPVLDESNIDACLLTVFFLGRYEDVMHDPVEAERQKNLEPKWLQSNSFNHHDGALALLQIWYNQIMPKGAHPSVILMHARRGLLRSCLLRNLPVPPFMRDGREFGESGLDLVYDGLVVKLGNAKAKWYIMQELRKFDSAKGQADDCPDPALAARCRELDDEARDVDEGFRDWSETFPTEWAYERRSLGLQLDQLPAHFYSDDVVLYASPAYAAVWNLYFAARILANATRLRAQALLRACGSADDRRFLVDREQKCRSRILEMADMLAGSIPFCLQRVDVARPPTESQDLSPGTAGAGSTILNNEDIKPYLAALVVWQLSVAAGTKELAWHKTWFKSELAYLGGIIGSGFMARADSDDWLAI